MTCVRLRRKEATLLHDEVEDPEVLSRRPAQQHRASRALGDRAHLRVVVESALGGYSRSALVRAAHEQDVQAMTPEMRTKPR